MKTYCLKSIYYGHCEERQRRSNPRKNRDWPRRGWTRHFLGHFALGRFAPAGLAMTNGGHKGQSIAEYFILISVISIAIVALGFVGRTRNTFTEYFTDAAEVMTEVQE